MKLLDTSEKLQVSSGITQTRLLLLEHELEGAGALLHEGVEEWMTSIRKRVLVLEIVGVGDADPST